MANTINVDGSSGILLTPDGTTQLDFQSNNTTMLSVSPTATTFNSAATFSDTASFTGAATFGGNATFNGDATFTGAATFSSGLGSTPISSANLTGALPALDGSSLTSLTANNLTGSLPAGMGGKILQVKSYTKTNTWVSSGNFKDPGLDVSITPLYSTSKILVNVSVCFSTNATTIGFYLRRNGTSICIANAAGSRSRMTVITECGNNVWQTNANYMYLDSPASTAALTYDIMIGSHDGREFRLNRSGSGTDNAQLDNSYSTSTITVMEVSA